jgi:hypothetical protein
VPEEQRGEQQQQRYQGQHDLEHCSENLAESVSGERITFPPLMRPERDNIAAPDLPDGIAWIGEAPESMPVLTAAGPALVHFLDFAQLATARPG